MRALRDMNLPKFVFEDAPLFLGLIDDLFPGLECPRTVNARLKAAVLADMQENGYAHSDEAILALQVMLCSHAVSRCLLLRMCSCRLF